jgi:hypothetical protein
MGAVQCFEADAGYAEFAVRPAKGWTWSLHPATAIQPPPTPSP